MTKQICTIYPFIDSNYLTSKTLTTALDTIANSLNEVITAINPILELPEIQKAVADNAINKERDRLVKEARNVCSQLEQLVKTTIPEDAKTNAANDKDWVANMVSDLVKNGKETSNGSIDRTNT